MKDIYVIYWSGTGNTEAMAKAVGEGIESGGAHPVVMEVGKTVGLFGSYDWGDGEWMRIWAKRMEDAGAKVAGQGVTTNNAPDEEALGACRELGEKLAQ